MSEKTDRACYERARAALWKALRDSDYFDHGGLASHEVVGCVDRALRAEFLDKHKKPTKDKAV